jgi:UDP-N-acetylglucosamine 2-epimerase (non-hydrolysing)
VSSILHVVGARPNLVKIGAVIRGLETSGDVSQLLVHTGQHYDDVMSAAFFRDLELPTPDVDLGVGSGSHSDQIARVMLGLQPILQQHAPDLVVVVGDVNSTLAAAVTAATMGILVAHVEAGLRSFDRTMPEELNRIVTDRVSDVLFTHSPEAVDNLLLEGVAKDSVHEVGNTMIDTLVRALPQSDGVDLRRLGVTDLESPPGFALVTLHRPSNVDDPDRLSAILQALSTVSLDVPVVFPVHPRTRARIEEMGGVEESQANRVKIIEPMGYLDFLALERRASVVITDSGGVQEETTYLQVPCVTVRPNTERPVTIDIGTNRLVPEPADLPGAVRLALSEPVRRTTPAGWDGHAGERIADVLMRLT